VTELRGPDWLTGGAFGIEGSAIDLVLIVLASAAMVMLARRRGLMVQPAWRRHATAPHSSELAPIRRVV
jgi:hypothetical protein